MNNKLIALAIAGAFAAPMAAQAAPTVYGIGQVEFTNLDSSATGDRDQVNVDDNKFGRFGIKGSEDLGGGLKSLYTFEFGIDTTRGNLDSNGKGSNNTIFERETSIGLKIGKAHEIRMGNIKSAYKYSGGVKYDSFVATSLQAREGSANTVFKVGGGMLGGNYGSGGFLANSISYKGNFKPVTVWLTTSLDETDNSLSTSSKNGVAGSVTSFGVSAKVSSFHFGVAGIEKDGCDSATVDCANDVDEVSATKLFGAWSKGQHTVRLQLESEEVTAGTGGTSADTDFIYLNYAFKMGKHLVDVALGEKDIDSASSNVDVEWSRIAYAYNFSKKTRVFVGVASRDTDGTGTDTDVTTVGMTVKF